jgi:hypothetical protein
MGNKLNSASAAGDPWTAELPGAYAVGSAGNIIGNKLDMAITDIPTANEIANALLDLSNVVEVGYTMRQALRIIAAAVAGSVAGGPTNPVFKGLSGSDRITGTADADGNRTGVTYTP